MGAGPAKAVLWDFGGVILESPFDAFARYEASHGLPTGFIRGLNATNPDTNAWARMERNEVSLDGFASLFEAEAAAAGHRIDARLVLSLLHGTIRPEMVEAVRRCSSRLPTGLVTNNFVGPAGGDSVGVGSGGGSGGVPAIAEVPPAIAEVMALFHVVIESSKAGIRKPDPRIYEMACDALDVAPADTVFLDDLGINLKPARAMGMRTIKVVHPAAALDELEAAVGFAVRAPRG